MHEFFHGWRRKFGVATLVVACVFAAGWIRSHNHLDHVSLNVNDETIHAFNSTAYGIGWMKQRSPRVQWFTGRIQASSNRITPEKYARMFKKVFEASNLCGFRVGVGKHSSIWVIPYWSIVIPLILTSAYLLLSKPRVAKPPESTNPHDKAEAMHA